MQTKREIFRFVQLRNVPQGNAAGRPPTPGDEDKPTPKERTLKFRIVEVERLKNLAAEDPKAAREEARPYLREVKQNQQVFSLFMTAARKAQTMTHIDVSELKRQNRKALKKLGLGPSALLRLQNVATRGYGVLLLMGASGDALLDAGEATIRGLEISRQLYADEANEQDVVDISHAAIEVNGLTRDAPLKQLTKKDDMPIPAPRRVGSSFMTDQTSRRAKLVPYNGRMLRIGTQSMLSSTLTMGSVPTSVGQPRKVSVGDLILTKEIEVRYNYADIAHIENVMQTESRARTHQIQTSNETVDFEEAEIVETSVIELKTTEQYELSEAISSATGKSTSMSASAGFSASYGPVSATASGTVSSSSTKLDSMSRASNYSREVVENSVNELSSRIKTSRRYTSKLVVTERNRHAFDNTYGPGHVVGVYRYIDREVDLQTINFGERLMLEFIVPEPAANLVHALANTTPPGVILEEPIELEKLPEDIMPHDYQDLLEDYPAASFPAPPSELIKVPASIKIDALDKTEYKDDEFNNNESPDKGEPKLGFTTGTVSVAIPDGYQLEKLRVTVAFTERISNSGDWWHNEWIRLACDGSIKTFSNKADAQGDFEHVYTMSPTTREGDIEIAWGSQYRRGIAVSISAECKRTVSGLADWQLTVWNAANQAYLADKRAYDSQLSYVQSTQNSFEDSPLANREKERRELKRAALTMLTEQDFSLFGSISFPPAPGVPTIDTSEAYAEGEYIRFFEEAVEWSNMAHVLYDYAWAGQSRWIELLGRDASDLEHEKFLQAGAAKITVPVLPGYEFAVLDFLQNGNIWDGEGDPPIDSDHPLTDLVSEMVKEPRDIGTEVIDEYTVTLPTNLVMLQQGPDLNNPETPGPIVTPPIVVTGSTEDEDVDDLAN